MKRSGFARKTYEEAVQNAASRSAQPRQSLSRSKKGLVRSPIRTKGQPTGMQGSGTEALRAAKKPSRKKKIGAKQLKKRVWKEFSIFIRTRNADEHGYVRCVTCPAVYLWNSGDIHAGHWIHDRLDFEERNVAPQCVRCNYHWNTTVNVAYAIYMARTYGVEVMDELRLLSNTRGNRYSYVELLELLGKYKLLNAANPLLN